MVWPSENDRRDRCHAHRIDRDRHPLLLPLDVVGDVNGIGSCLGIRNSQESYFLCILFVRRSQTLRAVVRITQAGRGSPGTTQEGGRAGAYVVQLLQASTMLPQYSDDHAQSE